MFFKILLGWNFISLLLASVLLSSLIECASAGEKGGDIGEDGDIGDRRIIWLGDRGQWLPSKAEDVKKIQRFELYSGIKATENYWFSYSTGSAALRGAYFEPGPRVRALASYGHYTYQSTRHVQGEHIPTEFQGQVSLYEAMLGYAQVTGELTWKAYLGVAHEEHKIFPNDPGNRINGAQTGLKGQLETWLNLGPKSWLSVDLSYSTTFDNYYLGAKTGIRLFPWLTLGPQISAFGNEIYSAVRGGLFATFHHRYGNLTAAAGCSGDYDEASGFFISANVGRHF